MNHVVFIVIVILVQFSTSEGGGGNEDSKNSGNSGSITESMIKKADQEAYEFGGKIADGVLNSVSDDMKKQIVQTAMGGSVGSGIAAKAATSDVGEKAAENFVGNKLKELTDKNLRGLAEGQNHEGQDNSKAGHTDQHKAEVSTDEAHAQDHHKE